MPKYTEFVTIPDLHLNAFANLFPEIPNPNILVYEACKQVVEYAKYNGIKNIIILGDIFENPEPDQEAICEWQKFIASLNTFNVYLIFGNHDYSNSGQVSLQVNKFINEHFNVPNVFLYMKPTETKIDGISFCFFPWPNYSKKKNNFKGPSVNIAHIELNGMLRDNGNKIKEGISITPKQDYWVIGHLHRYQTSADKRIIYPGTLYQKNFGEPLPKGFSHFKVKLKDNVLSMRHKRIAIQPPFELHNLRIVEPQDLKLVLSQINKRPILRYKLFIKKNAVALPPNFLRDNPHIIKSDGWRTEEELQAAENGKFTLDKIPSMELQDIVFMDLPILLKKYGLNKEECIRAKQIINGFVEELS